MDRVGRRRQPSAAGFDRDLTRDSAAPASAARLQAEAAFASRPSASAAPVQAQIIVRRARLKSVPAPAPAQAATPAPEVPAPDADAAAAKAARVFRLDDARPAEPAAPLPAGVQPPAAVRPNATQPARRRRSADKRPGPVLHAVLPAPSVPPEDADPPPRLAALGLALADLDPLLRDIARAQSFVFVDRQFDGTWQALSEQADRLRAELHAPRPWHR